MNESELRDREDFVVESSRLLRAIASSAPRSGATLACHRRSATRRRRRNRSPQDVPEAALQHISSNVKRLGLSDQRVRRGFEELADVIEYEHWEASAQLEPMGRLDPVAWRGASYETWERQAAVIHPAESMSAAASAAPARKKKESATLRTRRPIPRRPRREFAAWV